MKYFATKFTKICNNNLENKDTKKYKDTDCSFLKNFVNGWSLKVIIVSKVCIKVIQS